MAKVSININGRKYALGCDDGEEERLLRLGQKLDDRITMLANQFGQIGDLRLLVEKIRKDSEAALITAQHNELRASDSLIDAAQRIEKLAEKLSRNR